jgi:hypothetical protein
MYNEFIKNFERIIQLQKDYASNLETIIRLYNESIKSIERVISGLGGIRSLYVIGFY